MLQFQRFILLLVFSSNSLVWGQSTASQQVSNVSIQMPSLGVTRQVWVYLPKSYKSTNDQYPVLYMFDGQNIFDSETSYAGEWEVDEFFDQQSEDQIVVAIAHGNEKRLEELTPFSNDEYGGGLGGEFLFDLIHTVKPYIDSNYRTKSGPKHTSIAGASLGGLMAYYTVLKNPDVFSKALALSPSFWINPEVRDLTERLTIPKESRFYIVIGAKEGDLMESGYYPMLETLKAKQLSKHQLFIELIEEGMHNEQFWREQFILGWTWLQE